MARASAKLVITVDTQRGTAADARNVLDELLDELRRTDVTYASVGTVRVGVRRQVTK